MIRPMIRRLRTERDCDRHLRHHGGAAAADQAAVHQQHPGTRLRGLYRRIHTGGARSDYEHVGFDMHGLGHGKPLVVALALASWPSLPLLPARVIHQVHSILALTSYVRLYRQQSYVAEMD